MQLLLGTTVIGLAHPEAVSRGNLNIFGHRGICPAWKQSQNLTAFFALSDQFLLNLLTVSSEQYV